MGDVVSDKGRFGFGLAALALAVVAVSGALVMEGTAEAKPAVPPGRALFVEMSCGSCHVLKDAGGKGKIGPMLDGSKKTKAFVTTRISKGQGAMPGFGGTLTKQELDQLSDYVWTQSNS